MPEIAQVRNSGDLEIIKTLFIEYQRVLDIDYCPPVI